MKKTAFIFFSLVIITLSCKKDTTSSSSTDSSNCSFTTINPYSGSYKSKPKCNCFSDFCQWNSGGKMLSVNVYFDTATTFSGGTGAILQVRFKSKPITSKIYQIASKNASLNDSSCEVYFFPNFNDVNRLFNYTSYNTNEVVNVDVTNGVITASFNNITLEGLKLPYPGTPSGTAKITGTLIEGK